METLSVLSWKMCNIIFLIEFKEFLLKTSYFYFLFEIKIKLKKFVIISGMHYGCSAESRISLCKINRVISLLKIMSYETMTLFNYCNWLCLWPEMAKGGVLQKPPP